MSQLSNRIANAFINYANAFKETPDNRELAEKELKNALSQVIDFVQVPIYLDNDAAKLPAYAHYFNPDPTANVEEIEEPHATDACCDVVCTSIEVKEDGRIKCGTGIHVATEYRDVLKIDPNSRLTKTGYVVQNSPSNIDESYRGEIFIILRKIQEVPGTDIKVGDVIGQLYINHNRQINWTRVDKLEDLGETDRAANGFGSTSNKHVK